MQVLHAVYNQHCSMFAILCGLSLCASLRNSARLRKKKFLHLFNAYSSYLADIVTSLVVAIYNRNKFVLYISTLLAIVWSIGVIYVSEKCYCKFRWNDQRLVFQESSLSLGVSSEGTPYQPFRRCIVKVAEDNTRASFYKWVSTTHRPATRHWWFCYL